MTTIETLAVMCIGLVFVVWVLKELFVSQRDAEHLPVLLLCVDTYNVGSYRIAVNNLAHAQQVLNSLSFTHLHDVSVWDSANERVVASMDDNGVLV